MSRRQRAQCPGERPVTDHDGTDRATLGSQLAHDFDEPIGLLLRSQRTNEYERRLSCIRQLRSRMEQGGVSPVGYHNRAPCGNSEPTNALVENLVAHGDDEVRVGQDPPPHPLVEPRRWSRVGADDAVRQWTAGADEGGEAILHRVATVGHNGCRTELGEDPSEPEGESGVESLSGSAAGVLPEGQVDLHLGWAVEEAEQAVACRSCLVESVDQNTRRALCTSAPRRGYDVHDQRTAILLEMRRHFRASSPLVRTAAIAR